MSEYKIAVLGGGASGLMAASAAARVLKEPDAVLVLEGGEKAGKKLLATGNGRCNLTHLGPMGTECFFGDAAQLGPLLERYTPEKVRGLFSERGLFTVSDGEGRVYPRSMQAASVRAALLRDLAHHGAELRCGAKVVSVEKTTNGFLLHLTSGEIISAARCILAAGGAASPRLSAGTGYVLAKALGHTVTKLYPALTSLRTESSKRILKPLAGVRCDAAAALLQDGRVLAESPPTEKSEILFSETGVSGIPIFDLTAEVPEAAETGALTLALDLWREASFGDVLSVLLKVQRESPETEAGALLSGALHESLSRALAIAANIDPKTPASALSPAAIKRLAAVTKRWELPVTGTRGWDNAQVTAGGVPLREVDCRTFASKCANGLYLCGELLNVHGRCGGYNLHFAWASGHAAGTAAANDVCRKRREPA